MCSQRLKLYKRDTIINVHKKKTYYQPFTYLSFNRQNTKDTLPTINLLYIIIYKRDTIINVLFFPKRKLLIILANIIGLQVLYQLNLSDQALNNGKV